MRLVSWEVGVGVGGESVSRGFPSFLRHRGSGDAGGGAVEGFGGGGKEWPQRSRGYPWRDLPASLICLGERVAFRQWALRVGHKC